MLGNRVKVAGALVVRDAVLLAQRLHDGHKAAQMAVVHAGEQVMLHLNKSITSARVAFLH